MEEIKVSIIVPVYGVEKYIEHCARSLFAQTYNNCEFIFVNDCTKDNSMIVLDAVINSFPCISGKVVIINHLTNFGLAQARNTGVKSASGSFIMHVDSDDFIEPETVEECVYSIKMNNADAVIFGMRHIFKNGTRIEHVKVVSEHTEYIKSLIQRDCMVCICGGIYKKSLYVDYNIWAIPGLNMGEDYATKPRLLYNAKRIVALDKPFYNYNHINENSYTLTISPSRISNIESAIIVLSEFFQSKKDGEKYIKSLRIASLASKVLLLKRWSLSKSDKELFDMISCLYKNIPILTIPGVLNRLILILCQCNFVHLLRLLVKTGFWTKYIIKQVL